MIHSSIEPKGRTVAVPSCASHPGVLLGTLRSSTAQRPPAERAAVPWAMTSAHSGTWVSAYVDRIASMSAGKSKPTASALGSECHRTNFSFVVIVGLGTASGQRVSYPLRGLLPATQGQLPLAYSGP